MTRRFVASCGVLILSCVAGTAAAQTVMPPPAPLVPPAGGAPVYGPGSSTIALPSSSSGAPVGSGSYGTANGMPNGTYGATISSSTSVWSTGCQLTAAGPDDPMGDDFAGHFVADAGMYWIHPSFTANPAYGQVRSPTVAGVPASVLNVQDFRYGMDLAPEICVGYVTNSGLGARVRWWQFDQGSGENLVNDGTLSVFSAAPLGLGVTSTTAGDVFEAYSDLKITVWDFEGTQSVRAGCWDLLFGAGGRYCFMAQDYRSSIVDVTGAPVSSVTSAHNFTGGGPTTSFEAHRLIGETGAAFYSKARGTVLYGNAHEESFLFDYTGGTLSGISDSATNHMSLLPVAEFELGVEYGYELGRARLFAQAGLNGQVWFGAGNASNTNSGLSADNSGNLGFIGLAFRAGVTY